MERLPTLALCYANISMKLTPGPLSSGQHRSEHETDHFLSSGADIKNLPSFPFRLDGVLLKDMDNFFGSILLSHLTCVR